MATRPALVLLHGWGVNSGIWHPLLDSLNLPFDVTLLDLPGYGNDPGFRGPYSLPQVVDRILKASPPGAHWVAWSLGATIALQAAMQQPERFQSLQLVSATPRFLADEDWHYGMAHEPMKKLLDLFHSDRDKGLRKFLALQTDSRSLIRQCRERLLERPEPEAAMLTQSLNLLADTDLREQVLAVPPSCWPEKIQILAAPQDRLVPLSASRWLAAQIPDAHFLEFPTDLSSDDTNSTSPPRMPTAAPTSPARGSQNSSNSAGHLCFLEYPEYFLKNLFHFTGVIPE